MIGCDLFNTLLLAPQTRFALLPPTVRVLCSALTRRVGNDSREGLHFLWQHRLVRTLTLLCFGNSLSAGAVTGLRVRELRVRRAQGRQS